MLKSSFPYAINWTQENVPAILHMALNSQEEGRALATVLFGDYNPAGRLVQTWPKSLEQLPPMMDYDIRHGRTYMYFRDTPLYPFGYGSELHDVRLPRSKTAHRSSAKNRRQRHGVKIRAGAPAMRWCSYTSSTSNSTVSRPLKELADFKRVHLAPQEEKTIKLSIPASRLAYWNDQRRSVGRGKGSNRNHRRWLIN